MRSLQHPCLCPAPRSAFAGYRFPPEVITLAVRWYLRFGLSYRDVEELLAERGIEVDHVTVYRWVQRFAPEFAQAARARQHVVGDRWHVDETYLKTEGPGGTCSGRSISSARSSTCTSRPAGTPMRRGGSSPRRLAAPESHPSRSPPTGTGSTHASSMSCSRPPSTTRRSTPTIRSSPTTGVSRPASDRCEG